FAGFPVPPFSFGYVGSIVDFTFASYTKFEDYSQEIRFTYSGDNVDAMIGAYYLDQTSEGRDVRTLPDGADNIALGNFLAALGEQTAACDANPICGSISPFFGPGITVPRDVNELDTTNRAIFGLVSFDLWENTHLTLEGRWQSEKIEQTTVIQDVGVVATFPDPVDATFTSFTPKVSLDWQRSDNNLLYASVATGTKPGGFNGTVAIEAGLPTFEEEDVVSIELGSKNTLADGQMTLNLALFYSDVEGYQLTQNARSGANTTSATVNAGDADIFGVEIEIAARPEAVDGLGIVFNYAYTDAEFSEGFDQNEGVLNDAADNGLIDCSIGDQFPGVDGCTSLFGSIAGKKIPRTAEHQAFFDIEYRQPFGSGDGGWEWFLGSNFSYESSKFAQVHNFAETGSTTLVNARFGFTNETYTVNFWGRNLTGEESSPVVLRYADGAGSFRRSFVGSARRDTYVGVTASVRF
ncbi:MAG: TonB-dependent receptor, partial [Pseudomonadota bacterium]